MKGLLTIALCVLFTLSSQAQTDESGYKPINGTMLYYKTLGEGEPILVIHGGPGLSHDYLIDHFKPLAEKHKLIFYDQRVSGRSSLEVDTNEITLYHFTEDIEGLRKAFGIEKLNLMAHSWGGLLAMKYATAYPEKVKSLILINSTGASSMVNDEANAALASMFTQEDSKERDKIVKTDAFKNMEPQAIEQLMMIGFRHQFYDKAKAQKLKLSLNNNYVATSGLLQYLGNDLYEYDFHNQLKKIKAITLLIYGKVDPLTEIAGRRLKAAIPNAEMAIIEEAGHFPFIEQPEKFMEEVDEFLRK